MKKKITKEQFQENLAKILAGEIPTKKKKRTTKKTQETVEK